MPRKAVLLVPSTVHLKRRDGPFGYRSSLAQEKLLASRENLHPLPDRQHLRKWITMVNGASAQVQSARADSSELAFVSAARQPPFQQLLPPWSCAVNGCSQPGFPQGVPTSRRHSQSRHVFPDCRAAAGGRPTWPGHVGLKRQYRLCHVGRKWWGGKPTGSKSSGNKGAFVLRTFGTPAPVISFVSVCP